MVFIYNSVFQPLFLIPLLFTTNTFIRFIVGL